jgi:crotonobetainyl-CoA:carnitine CoA-transferase CaiB-like acyl-CoA transferase
MSEMSGMGQTGPYREHVTYGQTLMALAGAYNLTGYPDGSAQLPGYTYADFASPIIGAFAIAAALVWRQTSGLGQYIDLSQFQVTASLMAEPQFEALVNGTVRTRAGNAQPGTIVHNCFRCEGDDAWCAIVVSTDAEWAALRKVIGESLPAQLPADGSAAVEAAIEAWTMTRASADVMETLQAAGIDAGRVQNAKDIVEDPHLAARQYFEFYDHLMGERVLADGVPYKMSKTPGSVRRGGPAYGIDNGYVFGELLGLPPGRIAALQEAGVIA